MNEIQEIKADAPGAALQLLTAQFWREFYARHNLRHDPSPFACWCLEHHLKAGDNILELGCGNGRDSFAFLHHGISVLAVDGCEMAIADNIANYAECAPNAFGQFVAMDFLHLKELPQDATDTSYGGHAFDAIYSRFVLHAIPEAIEDAMLDFCAHVLPTGGRMLHEFRTIRDPLMLEGQVLSATERLTDHYRRFLDPDVFRAKLAARGWREIFFVESNGLAAFGRDDPVVARIGVVKK